ncbi:MAG: phosphoglucosamine mutase [Verrucomicrobiales bacterium]|nr:phosphoglucosamine mutase [Verrucomicrobiales bacterium]
MIRSTEKLFGTDGIRGEAGCFPLDDDTIFLLGQAASDVLAGQQTAATNTCVIGQDTRRSGDHIRDTIIAGLNSRGMKVLDAGVIPTPAIAFLTQKESAAFGIVISASHNPYQDNGIKFFASDAYKLDEEVERAVEERLRELLHTSKDAAPTPQAKNLTAVETLPHALGHYVDHVCLSITTSEQNPSPLAGLSIVLDSANGAAYQSSIAILKKLGAQVFPYFDQPDGVNINLNCGCTHPDTIENLVAKHPGSIGVAHDGDADRVALCDENGSALDGDELLAIAGLDSLQRGQLKNDTLVATTMSNGALDQLISQHGGQVIRTGVGDRQVIAQMRSGDHELGGEQSGHIIFRPISTTGDGIVAAVKILCIVSRTGKKLSQLRQCFQAFPQVQRNLVMTSKPPLESFTQAQALIQETQATLGKSGRILLRYSGTELLLRLLIEGSDEDYINQQADAIIRAIQSQDQGAN